MKTGRIPRVLGGAMILLASMFGGLQAQAIEPADVVILNDHMHVHKVLVFDAKGERHVLGLVGHDELKGFDVPFKIEAMGPYRIALQQHLPLPGLGVPANENPLKMAPPLAPLPGETISIIVGREAYLSSVEVVTNHR